MTKSAKTDGDLEQPEGGWAFDKSVADKFDSHVRKSIPHYDAVQTQTVKISDWFTRTDHGDVIYDLGCATGTTLKLLAEHHRGSDIRFVGVDSEEPMLVKARERLAFEDVQLLQQDLTESPRFPNASMVTSLFTMSFLPEEDRAELIARVYDDLQRGGAFVFVEKTREDGALFQDISTEHYWDFKRSRGFDEEEVIGKAVTLRGQLRPLRIDEYERMLYEAGFRPEDVTLWYKWYPWAGFIARKS